MYWYQNIAIGTNAHTHTVQYANIKTHTDPHGSLQLAVWGKGWTQCAGAYLKWGMMMAAKAHDWLSHLDQRP